MVNIRHRTLFILLVLVTWTAVPAFAETAAPVSCDCPDVACKPCEREEGVNFYSEKCGPNLSRVKSCKKAQCVPVANQEQCLAELGIKPTGIEASAIEEKPVVRAVAAAAEAVHGGEVSIVMGDASYDRPGARRMRLNKGQALLVGDTVATGEDGRVRVSLTDGSELFVSPRSFVKIENVTVEKAGASVAKRQILLNLMKGKVRSRVNSKVDQNQKESSFEVKTKSAVAGVRGTDFVASFEETGKEWTTEVRTLEGKVELAGSGKKTMVAADTYAAHVVPAPPAKASAEEIMSFLSRGFFTPIFKMTPKDHKALDKETDISFESAVTDTAKREVATGESLCNAPSGAFNQCSWTCEGNPKGSAKCQTEMPGVKCVRRLCRANGKWAEATALPIQQSSQCDGGAPVVRDCGGYW